MNTNFEHIDLIERYLDDDLNEREMETFQHLLNTNEEFNKLFFEMDSLIDGIRQTARETSAEEKLKALALTLPSKMEQAEKSGIHDWMERMKAILYEIQLGFSGISVQAKASLVIATLSIVISVPFIYNSLQSLPPSTLYESYFVKPDYEFGFNARSFEKGSPDDLSGEELFNLGINEYEQFNYGRALYYFGLIHDAELGDKVNFFSGICMMSTDQFEVAKTNLKAIVDKPDSFWNGQAAYFLGLIFLHEQDLDQAMVLFESVAADDDNKYQKQARQIIRKL
jgi:hypothetical protein